MYGEALRVANKHAPHLIHQINENYAPENPLGDSNDSIVPMSKHIMTNKSN